MASVTLEALTDESVERALVVVAHPDDADFWAGGTLARWSAAGIAVTYLILTDGDAGGFDPATPREDIPRIRRSEQKAAARILGVHDVRFLGLAEGTIVQGAELRRQIVRVIRLVRPRRLLTWSPQWNWSRFRTSCHVDHRATGEVTLTAAYPDAGNAFAHPDLIDSESLDPWEVEEIWMLNARQPNHYVDVTETFNSKIEALRAHRSQTGHRYRLADEMRERLEPNSAAAGLAVGRPSPAAQALGRALRRRRCHHDRRRVAHPTLPSSTPLWTARVR
ncbi:MAG: PIG-L domain-containing protein [Pseudonocardiales bacterium]|nr:MAG: PIG-L domain-containing protein [Pseudonocardiales bacterium]